MTENQKLREAVFTVLEGCTLNHDVRKILEAAYYAPEALALPARAAMSAGNAVDAQRYRWLREQSDDDFAFAVVKTPHFDVYESPEELDAAIDAAMRKGQL